MEPWNRVVREGLVAGSLASLLSTGVLLLEGRRRSRSGVAPVNAVAHWYHDRESLHANGASLRHTLPGLLTHHGAAMFWAMAHAGARQLRHPPIPATCATAAVTAAVAAFVDLGLTPRRLTPGFEHRLPAHSLVAVYAAFGAGLWLGARWLSRRRERHAVQIPERKQQLPIEV